MRLESERIPDEIQKRAGSRSDYFSIAREAGLRGEVIRKEAIDII